MRNFATLALAASLALLSACTIVTSRAPMGTESLAPAAANWDGTWASGFSAPVHLKVTPDGRVRMLYMNDDQDSLKAEQLAWTLMKHGDWTFASATDPDHHGEYIWVRIWREEEQIIAWLPNPEALAAWIRDAQLPGTVDQNGNVHLGLLEPQHLDFLTSEAGRESVIWTKPMALVRIGTRTGL